MFLSDLSNRFKEEGLDGILESVCSEFFQGFFKRQVDGKPVDLLSQEWRAWVGGVAVLTSVKGIAAKVSELFRLRLRSRLRSGSGKLTCLSCWWKT